jgi:hypothetical protein
MQRPVFFSLITLLVFCLSRCSESIETERLAGYWRIEKVTQENETFYPALGNIQYDHYTLTTDNNGYRKKLSPSLGESLNTSRDRSDFSLASDTDGLLLRFQTPWATWEEKILRLDSVELILEHNSKRYFYKRQYPTDGQL